MVKKKITPHVFLATKDCYYSGMLITTNFKKTEFIYFIVNYETDQLLNAIMFHTFQKLKRISTLRNTA